MTSQSSILNDIVESQNQIKKIKNTVKGINKEIENLESKSKEVEDELNQIPNKTILLKTKITKLSILDKGILLLNETKDTLELDLKHLSKNIEEDKYISEKQRILNFYIEKRKILDEQIDIYKEELTNFNRLSDVQTVSDDQKGKTKKLKLEISKSQKDASIERLKSLAKNGALLVLPIIINTVVNKLINNITKINQLNKEIDALNEEIVKYNLNPEPFVKDILVRKKNALLNKINQIQNSIREIEKSIDTLNEYNKIFSLSLIVAELALSLLPQPPAGTVGFQQNVRTIEKIINTAIFITQAISIILPIILNELNKAIYNLEEIKLRIKNIEDQLEKGLPPNQSLLLPSQLGSINDNNFYKGFKFVIKEEDSFNAPVVRGIKRHYGVAIDSLGIEVLKTDPSFTQNTEVLIDQLKFIIDSQNLKG